jgi:hypothetical protein
MSENLQDQVNQELARIADLELNEQPEAYGLLRDVLESALEALPESN